jgi:hypothetical protein
MKHFITFLAQVSLIVLLFSCTKIIYIGKRVDPEIILEKDHNDIVFVNLFDYTQPENVQQKEKASYRAGVSGLVDGLSSFSSDSSFSFVIGDTLKKGIGSGLYTTLLPADTITAICDRYKTNLLLSLDSLSIFFDWETTVESGYEGTSKTKNFYLCTKNYLSLYSADGDLINRSEADNSTLYRSRPTLSALITIKPSLYRARNEIEDLSFQAGQDYVSKFFPQMVQETKQLYTGKPFSESNRYVFARDWNKAIEILEQLTKNKDPLISKKAEFNLEIVKEAKEADRK